MRSELRSLILEHVERRPESKVRDIYKLLYQGVFGVGHVISDRAWGVLVEEVNRINLNEHSEDPLLEQVSPDGSMVRVNLRQFVNKVGDLKRLYDVMMKSGEHKGDACLFLDYWSGFKEMVKNGEVEFSMDDIEALDRLIRAEGVKPMHHTESYREAYYPAYRVVLKPVFDEMFELDG